MVVKLYVSGISGNKEVKKKQQRVQMILDSKSVTYEAIDITEPGREKEKEYMQQNSKVRENLGKHPLPPQIFNEDDYCGDYEDFDLANETDELEVFLHLPVPTKPSSFDKTPKLNGSREDNDVNSVDTSAVKSTEADGIEVELTSLSTSGAETNATTEDTKDGETAKDEVDDEEETPVPDPAKDLNEPPAESLDEPEAEENSEGEDSDEVETEAIVEIQEALNESKEGSTRETVFTDSVAEEINVDAEKSSGPDTNIFYKDNESVLGDEADSINYLNNRNIDSLKSDSELVRVSKDRTFEHSSSVNAQDSCTLKKSQDHENLVKLSPDLNSNSLIEVGKDTHIDREAVEKIVVDEKQFIAFNPENEQKSNLAKNIANVTEKEESVKKLGTTQDLSLNKQLTDFGKDPSGIVDSGREAVQATLISESKNKTENTEERTSVKKQNSGKELKSLVIGEDTSTSSEINARSLSRVVTGSAENTPLVTSIVESKREKIKSEDVDGISLEKEQGYGTEPKKLVVNEDTYTSKPSIRTVVDIEAGSEGKTAVVAPEVEKIKSEEDTESSLLKTERSDNEQEKLVALTTKPLVRTLNDIEGDSAGERSKGAVSKKTLSNETKIIAAAKRTESEQEQWFFGDDQAAPKETSKKLDSTLICSIGEVVKEGSDEIRTDSGVKDIALPPSAAKSFKGVTVEIVANDPKPEIGDIFSNSRSVSQKAEAAAKALHEYSSVDSLKELDLKYSSQELEIQKPTSDFDSKVSSNLTYSDSFDGTMESKNDSFCVLVAETSNKTKSGESVSGPEKWSDVSNSERSGKDTDVSEESEDICTIKPKLTPEQCTAKTDLLSEESDAQTGKLARRDTQRRISIEKKIKGYSEEKGNLVDQEQEACIASDSQAKTLHQTLESVLELEDTSQVKHEGVFTKELIYETTPTIFDVDKISITPQLQHVLGGVEGDEEKGIFVKSWNRRASEADLVKHVRSLLSIRDAKVASRRFRDGQGPDPHSEFLNQINCLISDVEFEEEEVSWPVVTPPKELTPPPVKPAEPVHPQSAFIQEVLRVLNSPSTPRILENPNKTVGKAVVQCENKFIRDVKSLLNSNDANDEGRSVYFVKERNATQEDEFVHKVRILLDEKEEEMRLASSSEKAEAERDHSAFLTDVLVLLNDTPMNETEMERKGELQYLDSDEEDEEKEPSFVEGQGVTVNTVTPPTGEILKQDTLIESVSKQETKSISLQNSTEKVTVVKEEPKIHIQPEKKADINLGMINFLCEDGEKVAIPLSIHAISKEYQLCLNSPYVQPLIVVDKEINIGDLFARDESDNKLHVAKIIVIPTSRASKKGEKLLVRNKRKNEQY